MLSHKKILLVDDDLDDLEIFISVLKEIDPSFEFKTANNGVEAIKILSKEEPPSLIFLDLNMPVMNGLECLHILKSEEKYKSIPVVMLTTSKDPPSVAQALKMGAKLFLTKAASILDIKTQFKLALEKDFVSAY